MTEQEKIEQAALVYGVANAYTGEMAEVTQDNTAKWAETDFKAGAYYYASEIMPGMLEKFSEWLRTFEALERQNGQWVIESQISDKQVVKAFLEDIKQKENVQPT